MNCVDLLDAAIRELSVLDEPPERNFIRKHTMAAEAEGANEDEATARFFSAPPGSYVSGVNPFNQPGVEAYKSNMIKLLNQEAPVGLN